MSAKPDTYWVSITLLGRDEFRGTTVMMKPTFDRKMTMAEAEERLKHIRADLEAKGHVIVGFGVGRKCDLDDEDDD